MGFFRSEDMYLYKFVVSKDHVFEALNALGRIDSCHFLDMNRKEQPFTLLFTHLIKRFEECERHVRVIESEYERFNIPLVDLQTPQQYHVATETVRTSNNIRSNFLFDHVEQDVRSRESFMLEQTRKLRDLVSALNSLVQYKSVLSTAS